jgi:hypothetical protein
MDLSNTGDNLIVEEPEPYDPFTLSREQIFAGNEIIQCFVENSNDIRWAILLAQMQSGKTETYLFIISELIRLLVVETAVIFSGNTETDLRDQLKKEVDGTGDAKFYGKYELFLEETLSIPSRTRREILANIKTHILVLWGTELNKHKTSYFKTLFIWEEAHHAQTINQCPDKFLKKIGISANGDVTTLKQKENFVISISATPFSEYSDYHHLKQHKKLIQMRPGNGYNSVKIIRDSGRLKSFNLVETGLRTALSTPHSDPKYAIVRISKKNEAKVLDIISCFPNWRHVIHDSLSTGIDKEMGDRTWNGMENAPEQDTVILIRGKCRMGKNLEKQHILFVMETAKNSNTDTVLQGLLGRVCGYSVGSKNIDVYIHDKIIKSGELQRYIELTDGEEIIPSKAMNIKKTTNNNRLSSIIITTNNVQLSPTIPIHIPKRCISEHSTFSNITGVINDLIYVLSESEDYNIENHNPNNIKRLIIGELEKVKENPEKVNNHRLSNMSYKSALEQILNAIENNIPANPSKKINTRNKESDPSIYNIALYYVDKKINKDKTPISHMIPYMSNLEVGSYYLCCMVPINDINSKIVRQLPKTTGKEIFRYNNILETTETEMVNGGFCLSLRPETATNANIMFESIRECVLRSKETETMLLNPKRINSIRQPGFEKYTGIFVSLDVYCALIYEGTIYNKIKSEFNVEIKLTKSKGRQPNMPPGCIYRLAEISWK